MLQKLMTNSLWKRAITLAALFIVSTPCIAEENASNPLAEVKKTDITGSSESAFESVHVKPIYFPKSGTLGE